MKDIYKYKCTWKTNGHTNTKKQRKNHNGFQSLRVLQLHCKEGKDQVFLIELTIEVEKNKINMMWARNKRKNENFHLISLHVIVIPNINIQKANNQDTNFNQNAIKIESYTLKNQMGIYNITN